MKVIIYGGNYMIRSILIISCLVFSFQNCTQPGSISLKNADSEAPAGDPSPESPNNIASDDTGETEGTVRPSPPPAPTPTPAPIMETIKNCELLSKNAALLENNVNLVFEDTKIESGRNIVCEFAPDDKDIYSGNLSIRDGYLRARYTQLKKLTLPPNVVICDLELSGPEKSFRYDDIFFFNFNGKILASNHKSEIEKFLPHENINLLSIEKNLDFFTYDWLKIRNSPFKNEANDFCLGFEENLSRCQWPITEQKGTIQLQFHPEILIRIAASRATNNQELEMVITGDNNPDVDCYHDRLDLKVKVKYYIKSPNNGM